MKLKTKLLIVLAVSAVLNALAVFLGIQPTGDGQLPVFTGLVLLLTPVVTCILAGILAGTSVRRDFWLVALPAVMNMTVFFLASGVRAGWVEINVFLGLLPGFIAMGITALIARKKKN